MDKGNPMLRFTTETVNGIVFWRMDKLDQILQVVGENQKTLAGIDIRLTNLEVGLNKLDSRVSRLEDNVTGINTRLMIVEDQEGRIAHIEEVVDRTFIKIDDFMVVLNRHESEIAALGMKYTRLEDRVVTLESQSNA